MKTTANSPAETTEVFVDSFNQGDVDALIAKYYTAGAVLAAEPGRGATGAALRQALARYFEGSGVMEARTRHCLVNGDTALLVIDWVIRPRGAAPGTNEFKGTSTDVVRRQADGTWRCLIDNPHGIS